MEETVRTIIRVGYYNQSYSGVGLGGKHDIFPSPARLFSAFVNAADVYYRNIRVIESQEEQVFDSSILGVFDKLEKNSPHQIIIPEYETYQCGLIWYVNRNKKDLKIGGITTNGTDFPVKTYFNGNILYIWDNVFTLEENMLLDKISNNIPYLGCSEDRVYISVSCSLNDLWITKRSSIYNRYSVADAFCRDSVDKIYVPSEGRLNYLLKKYSTENLISFREATSEDKKEENPLPTAYAGLTESCLKKQEYICDMQQDLDESFPLPWINAYVLPIEEGSHMQSKGYIDYANYVHKGLINIATNLPSWFMKNRAIPEVLTGKSNATSYRPANNVAIHYLPNKLKNKVSSQVKIGKLGSLIILVPAVSQSDEEIIEKVLERFYEAKRSGRSGFGGFSYSSMNKVSTKKFWKPVPTDCSRVWKPIPLVVTDAHLGNKECLDDSLYLSLGFVFREEYLKNFPGGNFHTRNTYLVEQAKRYIKVIDQKKIIHPKFRCFHNATAKHTFTMQEAIIRFINPPIPDPQAIIAIGQSRHFGIGLLEPYDYSNYQ